MPKLKRQSENQRRQNKINDMRQRRNEDRSMIDTSSNENGSKKNEKSDIRISSKLRQRKYLLMKKNLMKHKNRMKEYHASSNFKEKHKIYEMIRLFNFDEHEKHLVKVKLSQKQKLRNPEQRKIHQKRLKKAQEQRLQNPQNRIIHQKKLKKAQEKRLQDPQNRKIHQNRLKKAQEKRLQDPQNRKTHCNRLKVAQERRLQDVNKRKIHRLRLKLAQEERLDDPEKRQMHRERLKKIQERRLRNPQLRKIHNQINNEYQSRRLLDNKKKEIHNQKNKICQRKRLLENELREIHNERLQICQQNRLTDEQQKNLHKNRVKKCKLIRKQCEEENQRQILFNKFNLSKLEGPTYECSSCCRLWFKTSVKFFTKNDLNQCKLSFLKSTCKMLNTTTVGFLCTSCEKAIKKNEIPTLSLHNKELIFPIVPEAISTLTDLEERFICPRIPFMMIRAVINGGQYLVKGPAVNVPTNVETSVNILPRVQSEAMVIPICFRRKKSFKSNVMFENVRPKAIEKAANILKNSEVYKHCKIKLDFSRIKNIQTFQSNNQIKKGSITNQNSNKNSNNNYHNNINQNNDDGDDNDDVDDENSSSEDDEPANVEDESTLLMTQAIIFAPGEGEKPVSLFDKFTEALSFIKIYGGKLIQKPKNISYQNWIKSEIMRSDRRCASITKLFFSALKLRMSKLNSSINFCLRKNKIKSNLTVKDMLDITKVKHMEINDNLFKLLSHDRGTPSFWEEKKKNVFAMIRQCGPPTIFLTLSAAESRWPELIVILKKIIDNEELSSDEASNLDYKEKVRLINSDPVTVARYFDYRMRQLFKLMKEKNSIFRDHNITHFYIRVEFQQRGSPHVHSLLWLENSPKYNSESSDNSSVIEFINKFISCSKNIPEELLKLQTHKHTFTCKKGFSKKKCRFDIPFFPVNDSLILLPLTNIDKKEKKKLQEQRKNIQELLESNYKNKIIITTEEILKIFQINYDLYIKIICSGLNRPTVMIKRNPDECMINFYNRELLELNSANMDIQFILDMYSCASYVLNYLNKSISGLSRLMYNAVNEIKKGNYTMKEQLRMLANEFLKANEFSAQEAVYYILALSLSTCSEEVLFVNTNHPDKRIKIVKCKKDLEVLPPESQDIYNKSKIDHYVNRPNELEEICLAKFLAWYNFTTKGSGKKNKIYSDEEDEESDNDSNVLKLIDNSGYVRRRKKSKILRFINFNEEREKEDFIRENVMLFIPWRNEYKMIASANQWFLQYHNVIKERRSEFVHNEDIEKLLNEVTAQVNEENNESNDEEFTPSNLEIFNNPDFDGDIAIDNANLENEDKVCNKENNLCYVSVPRLIDEKLYINLVCSLNERQRKFLLHVLHCLKMDRLPFYNCVMGGAGVGKSRLIEAIHQTLIRFMNYESNKNLDSIKILLCAPTGKAAFGIKGTTLHATFILPLSQCSANLCPLSSSTRNTLFSKLKDLKLIIIDEISMVGSRMIQQVDCRLKQIFQTSKAFGGISIIVFGDFNQLSPVGDRYIFQAHMKDIYGDIIGNPLWNLFTSFQLQEIMRQKNDAKFAKALNNLANNSLSDEELNFFQSRVVVNEDDIPDDAIHLFRRNIDVDSYNFKIINKDSKKQVANAYDKVTGKATDKMKEKLINLCKTLDTKEAQGLPSTLLLSIGIKYMLTVNIDVDDGLVNGAVGLLKGYEKDSEGSIFRLWLDFLDEQVGKKRRNEIPKDKQINWTAIDRISRNIQPSKNIVTIIRKQFPIVPAEAITIYKSQGGTYHKIVVHLTKGMRKNELYVAFSRCTKLDGLYLIGDLQIPAPQNSNDKIQMEIKRILSNTLNPSCFFINNDDENTIVYQNIQSLNEKSHWLDMNNFIKLYKPCVFIAAETWTKPNDNIDISHYSIVHRVDVLQTCNRHAYGLIIYCRTDKKFEIIFRYNERDKTQSCSLVTGLYNDHIICTGYKSPSTPYSKIEEKILEMIEIGSNMNKKIIFIGDFNVDLIKKSSHSLFTTLNSKGLKSALKNNEITTNLNTAIDIIFSNFPLHCGVSETIFGYHKQLICILNKSKSNNEKNLNRNLNRLSIIEAIEEGKWLKNRLMQSKAIHENDKKIIKELHNFVKQEIYKSKSFKSIDHSEMQIPLELQKHFTPIKTTKNSNCFYNAISILLSGEEKLTSCLKALEAAHVIINQKFLKTLPGEISKTIFIDKILKNVTHAEVGDIIIIAAILERSINIYSNCKETNRRISPTENREELYLYYDSNSEHYTAIMKKKIKNNDIMPLIATISGINFKNFNYIDNLNDLEEKKLISNVQDQKSTSNSSYTDTNFTNNKNKIIKKNYIQSIEKVSFDINELHWRNVIHQGQIMREKLIQNKNLNDNDTSIIKKICNILMRKVHQFDIENYNTNVHIPLSLRQHFTPIETTGNGNCFYNAISTLLSGDEKLMHCLRALEAAHIIKNQEFLNNLPGQIKNTIFIDEILKDGTFAELGDIIITSCLLQRPINIYTKNELSSMRIAPVESNEEFYVYLDFESEHYTALIKNSTENTLPSIGTIELNMANFILLT